MPNKGNPVKADTVASSATVLMAGQAAIKAMTFTLNQLLLQLTTPEAMGISQLLEFVVNYVLFLCRESVRLSVPKIDDPQPTVRRRLVVNFATVVPTALMFLVGLPLSSFHLSKATDIDNSVADPKRLLLLVATCAPIELIAEPYYDLNQYVDLNFAIRAKIEAAASFVKCIVQFLTTTTFNDKTASTTCNYVYGWAYGQLAYALTLMVLYVNRNLPDLALPSKVNPKGAADAHLLDPLAWSYFKSVFFQQIFKHFLTEGDKLLVSALLDVRIQGYYAIISNYGSLLARLIFQPVEESLRINVTALYENDKVKPAHKKASLNDALRNVTKLYVYLLTLLLLFAPSSTSFLVSVLFRNFDAKDALASCFTIYWYYVPFLALNGVAEALFNSIFNNPAAVNSYSRLMVANSVAFFAVVYVLLSHYNLGLKGLVLGNMVNMSMRIAYCFYSLRPYISLEALQFPAHYIQFFAAAILVKAAQYALFKCDVASFKQFAENAALGVLMVLVIAYSERATIRSALKSKSS